jgi:hypothetical protein
LGFGRVVRELGASGLGFKVGVRVNPRLQLVLAIVSIFRYCLVADARLCRGWD